MLELAVCNGLTGTSVSSAKTSTPPDDEKFSSATEYAESYVSHHDAVQYNLNARLSDSVPRPPQTASEWCVVEYSSASAIVVHWVPVYTPVPQTKQVSPKSPTMLVAPVYSCASVSAAPLL